MAKRKRRGPIVINGESRNLGDFWSDAVTSISQSGGTEAGISAQGNADGTTTGWVPSGHADMNMWITQNGAGAPDSSVTSWTVDSPSPGLTTWYQVDPYAYTTADIGAATDTLAATGSSIATGVSNAVSGAANVLSGIFNNLTPILIALAALYVWHESERNR